VAIPIRPPKPLQSANHRRTIHPSRKKCVHPTPLLALLGIAQRQIKAKRPLDQGIKLNRRRFPETPNTPGEKLRKARIEMALTQRQLAVLLKVPKRYLSHWEQDQRQAPPAILEIVEKMKPIRDASKQKCPTDDSLSGFTQVTSDS
jgi:DNA-binding transcriptional regulator YiaG